MLKFINIVQDIQIMIIFTYQLKTNIMTTIEKFTKKIKSTEDCEKSIGKEVNFIHHRKILSGIVESYEREGNRIWFSIRRLDTGWLTQVVSYNINS